MAGPGRAGADVSQLLLLLDTAYDRASWHGVNLRGALRRVSPTQAAWRPRRGAHNAWELVVHAAYWKYAAWRRLTAAPKGSFALPGSNWFDRSMPFTSAAWRADVRLLDEAHRQLRDAVAALDPRTLNRRLPRSALTRGRLVMGVAAHDLYHAGQIQLLKKLSRSAPRRG